MPRVLLTDNIADAALAIFEDYPDIEAVRTDTLPPEELKQTIAGFDAIVVRSPTKLTADVIACGENLRFIGRAGVGVDNIDVEAATGRGIVVMNSPGGNTVSTAEHTIAVMMAVARHIPHAHKSLVEGYWDRKTYRGTELAGATLGVIGLGRVGREVARRMTAFDMTVIATDPFVTVDAARAVGAELVPMDDLLERSDWITVHVPLAEGTEGLIAEGEISRMKDGVVIINCARGGVVDEADLAAALESGKVAACGLDVFETEPPEGNVLFSHPRSVFTPHLGAATAEAQVRVATEVAESVAMALSGDGIRDAVNAVSRR